MQNDYIDFKFGDHWASEFNLLAVSSSDRYTPPVYGSVNPNIATIMGKKGVYKWKTQVNEKIFNINIAFDNVTIAQLNQIKQWLQPNKIQKLIFSEEPYKYYWAALNAEIDFSHLPFVEGEKQVGERTIIEGVYKGEMVISFVCIDNDGYSTEGTFEGLETENPSSIIKGNDFVLTDADNDYIEDLKIEGKSEQETKYNNTLSDTDFTDVNSRSVEKAWKTNNLAQIQAKNGEVTISAPYQYSGIAQEQREALIDHKYFASAEINTDSLDTALEIAGKNITNSIEGKDINITDGLVGPVDDLVVSGDASQDKLYNNEINSSFLEDLDNWDNQNNGKATISKQKATVIANEKYDGVSQYTEENNVGDKYYVRAKVQSNNTETALEVETEKGSAEGSSITINDASDNKLENIRIEGKHSQEHYDQKDLGEGEIISYNNADNYERYTKISVSGNSAQEVIEEVPGTEVEGDNLTVNGITVTNKELDINGNVEQDVEEDIKPSSANLSKITVLGQNTNLFNATDSFQEKTVIGLTFTPIENSSVIKINGTATSDKTSFLGKELEGVFEIGKTYYGYTNNENFEILFELYGTDVEVPIKTVSSFTMSSEYKKINLILKGTNLNGKTYNNEEIGIKIEEGKITNYTPYGQGSCSFVIANGDKTQKQEFVLPIQKPMLKEDYFDFKNKKEVHNWSRTAFTGEEKWALNATYTNTIRFSLGVSYLNANKIGYCNRSFIRTTQAHGDYEYMFYSSDLLYFNISKSSLPADKQNLEGFIELLKQWNSEGEPLELYYQTGEIEELALTDEQIAIGQQIEKAKLYLGTSNIYSDDEIAPYFTLVYNHILPSPSPEAPSEIQNVGDNINVFNLEEFIEFYSLTETGIDKGHNYVAYTTKTYENNKFMQGKFKANTQYTISFWGRQKQVRQGQTSGFVFKYTDGTRSIKYVNNDEIWTEYTLTSDKNKTIDYISMAWAYGGTIWLSDIKLEEGPNATSFSEYDCGNIDITVCNKNLFDEDFSQGYDSNGNIVTSSQFVCNTNLIDVIENENYTISNNLNLKIVSVAYYKDNKFISFQSNMDLATITIPQNVNQIRFNLYKEPTLSVSDFTFCQFEKKGTATDYIEHEEQKITFPLSQGQKMYDRDYLADDGIHHVRKQIELDGTENWFIGSITSLRYAIRLELQDIKLKTTNLITEILSNCFLRDGSSENSIGYENKFTFRQANGSRNLWFFIPKNFFTTTTSTKILEEWKAYLSAQKIAGTPVTTEYPLAEEEIEAYTETQKEIYNNLTHLTMYNGQNTLTTSNKLKPQLKWEIPESPSPDYPIEVNIVGQEDFKINASSNNFLNTNNINFSSSALGINVKSNTDGSLKVSGTAIKNGYFAVQVQTEFFKPLKKGTRLTLNFGQNKKLLRDSRLKIFAWTYDKNNVSGGLLNSATPNYSIVLSTDVTKITWGIEKFVQGTVYNDDIYITLNSEEEINSYIKNKQEISNIECQRDLLEGDYINLNDNNETHIWNYKELDGTENWQLNSANTFVILNFDNMKANIGLCSHYKMATEGVVNVDYGFAISPTILYIKNKDINTVEEFKSWLTQQKNAGNPIKIYWKRSEVQKLPLTTEQKAELQKLRSYREITNIISNDILQPNMKVEYIKKPSYTTKLTGNTEQLLSLIYQTNIDKTKILLNNISDNNNSFTFTHPILINLTKQFGSGKEPTKEWLDTNIDFWDVAEGGAPSVETSSRVKTVGSNINLFDPDNHIELDGQYRHYSEGKIVGSANFFGIKIPVLGNTVYSVNSNLSRNGYSNLCYYDKDFTFMWGEPFTEGQTFRTPFNCRYITLALNKNYDWFTLTYGEVPIQKVNYNLANIDMQISGYDNQFKSFPLSKSQELLQLPNGTQDTLEADGIHKRVEKIIINGTENWLKQNGVNHEKTWRFIFSRTNGNLSSAKNNCYCDKFINYSADDLWNEDIEGIAVSKSQVIIRINSEKAESVVELKQLLQDNNLVLYLPKVSEEIIPYSNAQKAWYDNFEIYRKNTQITTIAETKPWYSFTYDINDTYSVNSTKVNEYEKLGLIFNNLEDRPRFIVNRTADGSGTIKMRKPLVVDLTNAFGAGKEPDLAWCLENITFDNSCEYGTPSPNVPSELVSVGSNPIKIENKSRNLIKEQNLLNWTKEYCTVKRLTEKYDSRNIYRISFENHKKGTISTRIQQKKGDMVFSIYARVIQADNPTVNRLVVAKVTSDSSASTVVSHKSFENLIGEWQKIYIPITSTTISDAAELVLEVQHNADTDDSTIIDLCMPQLEEGFTPHDYIPYAPEKVNNLTFTTPLRQLKNGVKDEFSKNGIIRRVGEHTIKSSDTVYWIVFNQDKSYVTICGQLGIYVRGDNSWDAPSFYCNRIEDCTSLYRIAQAKSPAPSRTKEGIGIIDSEYRMCLRADLMGIVETDTKEDMIRKYKVLLDEKPFTIYYEKEVADIEPLTELQKNTLANLVTRKQYDHWLISGDLNPKVELSYKLTSSINDIHPWVTGSNLLDKTWFYNDNNIHTKPYVEVDTGDADKSGISATRPIYLLNSGTETANLSLTFDYINIETPLTIQTYSGKFTDDGFVEEAKISEIIIEPFTNYQPFKDIYDNNPANWKIEIDSTLGEVYLRHNTDETKVLNLNRFNKDHTFLSLADCNFVDYDKVFPTIISEIEGTAIENTIFNKVIVANTADNYRLKNVNVEWKHSYL